VCPIPDAPFDSAVGGASEGDTSEGASSQDDMGVLVVAEGVETKAEREALIDLGCDLLQGFLFARPAAAFPEARW
jgi:diguanylate cyclase